MRFKELLEHSWNVFAWVMTTWNPINDIDDMIDRSVSIRKKYGGGKE